MDHNSLVLRIEEVYNNNNNSETFIFYDHTQNLFGIRGYNLNSYSFYSDDVDSIIDFIQLIHKQYDKITICLEKYINMPEKSDYIYFNYLKSNYYSNK